MIPIGPEAEACGGFQAESGGVGEQILEVHGHHQGEGAVLPRARYQQVERLISEGQ
jgi:hypothetical protein